LKHFLEADTVEIHATVGGTYIFRDVIVLAVSLGAYVMLKRFAAPPLGPDLRWYGTQSWLPRKQDYSIRWLKTIGGRSWRPNDGFKNCWPRFKFVYADVRQRARDLARRVNERTVELETGGGRPPVAQEARQESEWRIELTFWIQTQKHFTERRDGPVTSLQSRNAPMLGYEKPKNLWASGYTILIHHTHANGTPRRRRISAISAAPKARRHSSDEECLARRLAQLPR